MNNQTQQSKDNTLMSTLLAAGLLMALAAPLLDADNAGHSVSNAAMESARRATGAAVPTVLRTTVDLQPAIIVSTPRLVRTA